MSCETCEKLQGTLREMMKDPKFYLLITILLISLACSLSSQSDPTPTPYSPEEMGTIVACGEEEATRAANYATTPEPKQYCLCFVSADPENPPVEIRFGEIKLAKGRPFQAGLLIFTPIGQPPKTTWVLVPAEEEATVHNAIGGFYVDEEELQISSTLSNTISPCPCLETQ